MKWAVGYDTRCHRMSSWATVSGKSIGFNRIVAAKSRFPLASLQLKSQTAQDDVWMIEIDIFLYLYTIYYFRCMRSIYLFIRRSVSISVRRIPSFISRIFWNWLCLLYFIIFRAISVFLDQNFQVNFFSF